MSKIFIMLSCLCLISCTSVGTVTSPNGDVYKVTTSGNSDFKLKTKEFTASLERKPIVELKVPDIKIDELKLQED